MLKLLFFHKVSSLEGVYIANAISQSYMKNAEQELEEMQMNKDLEMGQNQDMNTKSSKIINNETSGKKIHKKDGYKEYIKSLITFNKGGDWKRIKAPERDVEGKKYDCGEFCYLNLYGISSDTAPYYSVDSAAGILIANGSVGRYLSRENDSINTFLSRDGGLNWFEIKKGTHIYEIGDHGGLILIADDVNPASEIFYSWDEGLTFEPLKISEEKFLIKNIIIEPTSTSQHFIIYGESQKKGDTKGVVIGVDFSNLHEPQCKYPDIPDTQESDYEKWSPNDGKNRDCLMGHKTIYIRRKRESKCFNGLAFERKNVIENCECTESDYECDFGFARKSPGEPCISIHKKPDPNDPNDKDKLDHMVLKAPEKCEGYYKISRGYRKVPGNTCINGVKFDPLLIPCPYNGIFAGLGIMFFIILVALFIIFIYFAFSSNLFGGSSALGSSDNYNYNNNRNLENNRNKVQLSNKRDYKDIVRFFYLFFIFYL